ncbi:hypothetical protein [Mycolicibacterium porcinum]|uniref:hypothetical protein n=1 Tax=Mycolicibacterium porcinum TaxID=39693 RepID=UPI0008488728|nr:hypothetical protein [Mycolicibacterium porcinum]ODR25329.1 hypothetical protein BHQ19_12730 [Mycolicibacterium porcinum]
MTKQPQSIETQVALLSQFNVEVVKPFIEETRSTQKAILDKLDSLDYVPRSEFVEYKLQQEQEMTELQKEVRKRDWRTHTLTSAVTLVATLITTYVINDIFGGR